MKKLEEVKLESKENTLINASAQCMLDLLHARFFDENMPKFLKKIIYSKQLSVKMLTNYLKKLNFCVILIIRI